MRKRMLMIALVAIAVLGLAGVAQAARVTGGTTTVTPSSAAAGLLSANNISVTPLAPATASNGSLSFPIARGRLNLKTLHGVILHRGGISLSNATRKINVRRPVIVSRARGAFLVAGARVPGRCHARRHKIRCFVLHRFHKVRIARLTDVKLSGATATATLKITPVTATIVNLLAGKHVVDAGAVLGTATVAPTLKAKG